MEPVQQPTFIPKKTLAPQPAVRPARNVSLFSLISTIVFITVLVLSISLYGYEYYLKKQLEERAETLKQSLARFESSLVADLTRLDARIELGKALLGGHVAASKLFSALGRMTLRNVYYTNFSFEHAEGGIKVLLDGRARNFSEIGLQAAEFEKPENQKYFKDTTLESFNLDEKGNVTFKMSALVDSQSLLYVENVEREVPQVENASSTTQ